MPSGEVERHAAQRMRAQGAHAAAAPSAVQQPPGLGRDALAADLVAREARLVQQQDVVAALAQEDGGGRARGPAADHHDVARGRCHHAPGGRSATASRR